MKIDNKNLFLIVIISSFVGIIYNFVSVDGIPLLYEKKELIFADDEFFDDILRKESVLDSTNISIKKTELKPIEKSEKIEIPVVEQKVNEIPKPVEPQAITLEQAYRLFNSGTAVFLDARDEWEFDFGHITGAVNLPYYDFDEYKQVLDKYKKDQVFVTYCGGDDCELSVTLGNKLSKLGYTKIFIFFGGWNDWINAGYPINEK